MRKLIILGTLAFASPALISTAFATELTMDTHLGKTVAQVKSKLTEMGYEVRKSEMEDGRIEVYVVKDNKISDVYVSPVTGKVTRLKKK